mmetsp:Transcript_16377/g.28763  ORF Transcript_16377/g.28763 Transcript_16377/m.28763 type:complete len:102 (+) Transcript_16377:1986-2291(+)
MTQKAKRIQEAQEETTAERQSPMKPVLMKRRIDPLQGKGMMIVTGRGGKVDVKRGQTRLIQVELRAPGRKIGMLARILEEMMGQMEETGPVLGPEMIGGVS